MTVPVTVKRENGIVTKADYRLLLPVELGRCHQVREEQRFVLVLTSTGEPCALLCLVCRIVTRNAGDLRRLTGTNHDGCLGTGIGNRRHIPWNLAIRSHDMAARLTYTDVPHPQKDDENQHNRGVGKRNDLNFIAATRRSAA